MAKELRASTLTITDSQMAAVFNLFEPLFDELVERIAARVKQLEEEKEPRYYSRKEVADLLHVTLPTLHTMVKGGVLNPKKVGGRVLFAAQAVDEAIKCGTLRKSTWRKGGAQ